MVKSSSSLSSAPARWLGSSLDVVAPPGGGRARRRCAASPSIPAVRPAGPQHDLTRSRSARACLGSMERECLRITWTFTTEPPSPTSNQVVFLASRGNREPLGHESRWVEPAPALVGAVAHHQLCRLTGWPFLRDRRREPPSSGSGRTGRHVTASPIRASSNSTPPTLPMGCSSPLPARILPWGRASASGCATPTAAIHGRSSCRRARSRHRP